MKLKKRQNGFVNSVDPDEVACEPSHLYLHCFVGPSLQVCRVERVNEGLTTASEPS